MKLIVKVVIFLLLSSISFASEESVIALDIKGDTALVTDIVVTKDHKLITSSDDKSIRLWSRDGKDMECRQQLLAI